MPWLFSDRSLRRLLVLMLATEFLWGMGAFIISGTTVSGYLRERVGESPFIFAALSMAMGGMVLLPQIFARAVVDRFRRRKRGIILLHCVIIAVHGLMPLVDWLCVGHPALLATAVIAVMGISAGMVGLVGPVWIDMLGRLVPIEVRGQFFGFSSGLFATGGILGGSVFGLMRTQMGPAAYPWAFVVAAALFAGSMVAYACAPVPESALSHDTDEPMRARMAAALRAVVAPGDFRRFAISVLIFGLVTPITVYLMPYAMDVGGLAQPPAVFGLIPLLQAIGGALGAFALGWLGDRHGPRTSWLVLAAAFIAMALLVPLAGTPALLWSVAFLSGPLLVAWAVFGPAVLAFSPDGDKSSYVAVLNVLTVLPTLVGPLLLALLIRHAGHNVAFVAAADIGLLALVCAWGIGRRRGPATPVADMMDVGSPIPAGVRPVGGE
jgi:MFS family permease